MMKTKRMKNFCMLCAMALCTGSAFSQTLIYYGNSEVGKDEFLRAYNKNKPAVTDKEKALRDYLDLYTNFKLKVKAAQELHLDTVAQIRYDVQNFREQVTENYMGDDKGIQALVDEGAARAAKDMHVVVFSIPVAAGAKPEDTLKAYNAAKEIYSTLQKESGNYADAAEAISEKYVPVRYSDAGFVTAFALPYEFENIVYNTKPGNVSAPYRNAKGWYVLKVTEERPDAGKWRVAQVLLAFPPNADNITKLAVKQKADSVYGLLQKGLPFGDAAKLYSDDRMTYMAQGELPEFSTGRYDPAFEAQVFKLAANNDITAPFETPYGYHIVKRINRTPIPADKNDPSYQFDIKQKVIADSRMNSVREKFAKDIMVKTGYKRPAGVTEAELYRYADTLMKNPTIENTNDQPISKKNIIVFKDGSPIKGDEWLKYIREVKSTPDQSKVESNKVLWDKFATQSALNYYKKNLESYNSDFKYQMQEFREGNMLFEIMERNVWGKAGTDNAALKSYYEAHKTNYKWAASADVIVLNCANEKAAAKAIEGLKDNKSLTAIAEGSNNEVQADSGRYELNQITDKGMNPAGAVPKISDIIKNEDGTTVVIKYLKFYPGGEQRTFEEARGLVINDYQNVLEQQWVEKLKVKYPVKINEKLFQEMIK